MAEAAVDEGGRDGDRHHRQHQQRREDKKRHRQPEQPQEDGRGGEQRVHQRDGALRGLADHQAVARLKGVVLEERIGHGWQFLHDALADYHPGLLAQDGGGAIAQDDAQSLHQDENDQAKPDERYCWREMHRAARSNDLLQELVQQQQQGRVKERLEERGDATRDKGTRMGSIQQAQRGAQRRQACGLRELKTKFCKGHHVSPMLLAPAIIKTTGHSFSSILGSAVTGKWMDGSGICYDKGKWRRETWRSSQADDRSERFLRPALRSKRPGARRYSTLQCAALPALAAIALRSRM